MGLVRLGDLSKPTAPAYFFGVKLMFGGVMLMFVGVMNFGPVQKIRFFVVKIFWSNTNQFSVILIQSIELASFKIKLKLTFEIFLISSKESLR